GGSIVLQESFEPGEAIALIERERCTVYYGMANMARAMHEHPRTPGVGSEPGAAELRRLARHESGRVCQRVLMIANLLEGMEHEEAARLAGLSRSAAYEWHNRYEEDGIEGLRDRPRPGRQPRVDAVTGAWFKERIVAGAELERDGVVAFRAVDAQRILKEEF